jgi:hypothetical protein
MMVFVEGGKLVLSSDDGQLKERGTILFLGWMGRGGSSICIQFKHELHH